MTYADLIKHATASEMALIQAVWAEAQNQARAQAFERVVWLLKHAGAESPPEFEAPGYYTKSEERIEFEDLVLDTLFNRGRYLELRNKPRHENPAAPPTV